ncbi:solute carrier family 23 protein [uncultured Sneathiella sp.]|uniref:uracil-xanthine permease family protein n=1 Tax=uncultured Sneathiella sp. TaxID=879315 RepID=UPI0030EE977F|tara:strand:+ start:1813 stop:3522 length:1710 start_codon:yes stop_codon:yes gene_type:complete
MAKRPEGIIYAVDERPPLPTLLLLALQYAGLLAAYLVLIVIVFKAAGASQADSVNAISLGMIAVAVATIIQALRKGPIGSGFLAAPVFSAIYLGPSVLAAKTVGLPAVFGMTILAGLLEIIIAGNLHRLRIFFPPAISGFIVSIIGIQLGLVAIDHVLDIQERNLPDYGNHVIVAGLTLAITVGLSIWASGLARLMCSMVGLIIGFLLAVVFGLIPPEHWQILKDAPILALPDPSFISYDFDASLLPAFLISGIAAALRTVGVITTCQKINDDDWRRPDIKSIKGGMYADGLGCMLAGALGTMGTNAAPSLVGVSKASGATSRYIGFVAAGVLVFFSLMPVIASFFLILPNSVIGAILMFTAAFMISGGIQIMMSHNIDSRMTYVIGFSMLLGLSRDVFHDYFKSLPPLFQPFTSSMMPIAVLCALALHLIFRIGSRRKTSVGYDKVEHSIEDFSDIMEKQGRSWNIDPAVASRAESTTEQVLEHIRRASLATGPVTVKMSYDDFNFVISIEYQGMLLSLPHVGTKRGVFLEEEAFSYGLADFLIGAYPDRMESFARGPDITITLRFNV